MGEGEGTVMRTTKTLEEKAPFLLFHFLCTEPGRDVLKPEGNTTDPPDSSTE